MKVVRTILIGGIVVIVLLVILETYFSIPFVINLIICYIILCCSIYSFRFFSYKWTKDITKIEKIVKKRKSNHPYYTFILAISNKDDQKVIASYRKMMKNKQYFSLYPLITVLFSLNFNNTLGIEEEIKKIKQPSYRIYYQTLLLIKQDDLDRAELLMNSVKTKWMKEALLTEWYLKQDNQIEAKKHALLAIKRARGIMLYVLFKEYEELI